MPLMQNVLTLNAFREIYRSEMYQYLASSAKVLSSTNDVQASPDHESSSIYTR